MTGFVLFMTVGKLELEVDIVGIQRNEKANFFALTNFTSSAFDPSSTSVERRTIESH